MPSRQLVFSDEETGRESLDGTRVCVKEEDEPSKLSWRDFGECQALSSIMGSLAAMRMESRLLRPDLRC